MKEVWFVTNHEAKLYFYSHLIGYLSYVNEKQCIEAKSRLNFFSEVTAVNIFNSNTFSII